jgi:hypothetical protein
MFMQKTLTSVVISIFFCLVILVGCTEKDSSSVPPKIPVEPLPYLPAYPGSYWKLSNGIDTVMNWTSGDYEFFQGKYFVKYNGAYLNQYQIYSGDDTWHQILSERVGDYWTNYHIWNGYVSSYYYMEIFRVLQKKKDTLGDSIIVLRISYKYIDPPTEYPYYLIKIYKKNVGLVFECDIDTITKDTTQKRSLVEYFINH